MLSHLINSGCSGWNWCSRNSVVAETPTPLQPSHQTYIASLQVSQRLHPHPEYCVKIFPRDAATEVVPRHLITGILERTVEEVPAVEEHSMTLTRSKTNIGKISTLNTFTTPKKSVTSQRLKSPGWRSMPKRYFKSTGRLGSDSYEYSVASHQYEKLPQR